MATTMRLRETVDALLVVRDWLEEPNNVAQLIDAGGDLDAVPELRELLEHAELTFEKKVENVGLFVLSQGATIKAIKEEIDRLAAAKKTVESAQSSLKQYLREQLERANVRRVDGTLAKVRVQANPVGVKSALTDDQIRALYVAGCPYVRAVTKLELDGQALQDAYERAVEEYGPAPELGTIEYAETIIAWREAIEAFLRTAGVPEGVIVDRGSHTRVW
jgi:hypothetical protein